MSFAPVITLLWVIIKELRMYSAFAGHLIGVLVLRARANGGLNVSRVSCQMIRVQPLTTYIYHVLGRTASGVQRQVIREL